MANGVLLASGTESARLEGTNRAARGGMQRLSSGVLLSVLVLATSGCPTGDCPDFDGVDETLRFTSCLEPGDVGMTGSSFEVSVTDGDDSVNPVWTSSDESVAVVIGPTAPWQIELRGPGAVELSAASTAGTDRFSFEVADAASVALRDEWGEAAVALTETHAEQVFGEIPPSMVGDRVQLPPGESVELQLEMLDAQDRVLQWSTSAVDPLIAESIVRKSLIVEPAGFLTIRDAAGNALGAPEIVEVPANSGTSLTLGVWHPERPESAEEEPTEESSASLAWLMAFVTDADGGTVYQPPVVWSSTGPGHTRSLRDWEQEGLSRADVAIHMLEGDEVKRVVQGKVCSSVSLQTAVGTLQRSAWITPSGVTLHEDGTCGGQAGCACNSAGSESPPVFALLGAVLLLNRRRR